MGLYWSEIIYPGERHPTSPQIDPVANPDTPATWDLVMADMKARGMLEDTLIIWTTEFGRFPFTQGATGRDHNAKSFVTWLAGAGVKPGVAFGKSDDFAYEAVESHPLDHHPSSLGVPLFEHGFGLQPFRRKSGDVVDNDAAPADAYILQSWRKAFESTPRDLDPRRHLQLRRQRSE